MKTTKFLALAVSAVLVGCEQKPAPPQAPPAPQAAAQSSQEKSNAPAAPAAKAPTAATAPGNNPLNAPTDYLGGLAQAKKNSEKTIELVSLKKAVDQFYAQEGRYPKDLQELVKEKYLGSLPPAPVGMKIEYDAKSGEVKILPQ